MHQSHDLNSLPGAIPGTTGVDALSERELEILRLVGAGLTNQEICGEVYLSINTVKTYIRSAYRKIGARNRAAAVIWVLTHVDPPHPAGPVETEQEFPDGGSSRGLDGLRPGLEHVGSNGGNGTDHSVSALRRAIA